jgi:hypothetical protein
LRSNPAEGKRGILTNLGFLTLERLGQGRNGWKGFFARLTEAKSSLSLYNRVGIAEHAL